MVSSDILFNPKTYDPVHFDPETRRLLRSTIDWFEQRGKATLLADYFDKVFYSDFLDFVAKERIFATFFTPAQDAGADADKRWDTSRIAAFAEILGFYGLNYWYPMQVTVLGLGPVWQSANPVTRARAAAVLEAGGVAAFGLSEQSHGADIYSTDMVLTPDANGGYIANGEKYYIGNGQNAGVVSVWGRIDGIEGADQYVFFFADSSQPNYHVVKNVVAAQMFVSHFRLQNYAVGADEIMHTGEQAFSAALNTVNVGKFNLCFGGIGMATHSLYEAITHAHNRVLYGKPVTAFPHVRREFVDAYSRLIAMTMFADRAIDYFRSAHGDDRRYLLFNAITKMKVTTEAQRVIALLADVVAAKGFEKDSIITVTKLDIDGLPKLEGTVAVNLALILKFMPAYVFMSEDLAPVPTRTDAADDDFLWNQGPARGLGKVRFHDWRAAYARSASVPNVARFTEQAEEFAHLLTTAAPEGDQIADMDLQIALGELFTLVVYGQLILEQAEIIDLDHDVLDQIFETLVRDFSIAAIELHGRAGITEAQQDWAIGAVRRPATDRARFDRVWAQVVALSGVYEMSEPGRDPSW